jgi:hypothetical protein
MSSTSCPNLFFFRVSCNRVFGPLGRREWQLISVSIADDLADLFSSRLYAANAICP